jgi:hypothetical protein
MNYSDSSESGLSSNSTFVEELLPGLERPAATGLYWFQDADEEGGPTEEWSFADPQARAQAMEARLRDLKEGERILLPCHGLAEATLLGQALAPSPAAAEAALDLASRFRAQADRTPDAVAVASGAEHLTYAELDARSDALAWHLREHGVRTDVRVGLCVERSPAMVAAMLGILKAGGTCVPLKPDAPDAERIVKLEATGARVLITRSDRGATGSVPGVSTVFVDWEEAFELGVLGPPRADGAVDDAVPVFHAAGAGWLSQAQVGDCFRALDVRMGSIPEGAWLAVGPDCAPLELLWALMRGLRVVV